MVKKKGSGYGGTKRRVHAIIRRDGPLGEAKVVRREVYPRRRRGWGFGSTGRRGKRRRVEQPGLKIAVRKLMCSQKMTEGRHIHRQRDVGNVAPLDNTLGFNVFSYGATLAEIEGSMASIRYYDPGTNAMVTADPSVGTFQRDIRVSIYKKLQFRNNFQVPCWVQIVSCTPKDDTNLTPFDAYSNGLADQGGISAYSPLTHFSDSLQLKALWHVKTVYKKCLQPGQQGYVKHFVKEFCYNFSVADSQTDTYRRKHGCQLFMIRVHGPLGHDNGGATWNTEVGVGKCGVDWMHDTVYTFRYDAGKKIVEYSHDDNSSSFTSLCVSSNRPTSDNQGFAYN